MKTKAFIKELSKCDANNQALITQFVKRKNSVLKMQPGRLLGGNLGCPIIVEGQFFNIFF